MVKTVDELIETVNGLALDDDSKIALMEDVTDSMKASDDAMIDKAAYDELEAKYADLQARYKERFMDSGKKEPDPEPEDKDEDETIIDIKEI